MIMRLGLRTHTHKPECINAVNGDCAVSNARAVKRIKARIDIFLEL